MRQMVRAFLVWVALPSMASVALAALGRTAGFGFVSTTMLVGASLLANSVVGCRAILAQATAMQLAQAAEPPAWTDTLLDFAPRWPVFQVIRRLGLYVSFLIGPALMLPFLSTDFEGEALAWAAWLFVAACLAHASLPALFMVAWLDGNAVWAALVRRS